MAGQGSATRRVAVTILLVAAAIGVVRATVRLPPPPSTRPIGQTATRAAPAPISHDAALVVPSPPSAAPAPATPVADGPLAIHRIIDTGGPIKYGRWFWDDTHADGPITITVDLKASVLSVFRGGDEIGTTAVIYGADDRETPLGTFPILEKDRHHVSNLYHAPMPYMLRLTRDGISIHASDVAADYATHGCIGVPAGFARLLFDTARVGDRVIVTNRGMSAA